MTIPVLIFGLLPYTHSSLALACSYRVSAAIASSLHLLQLSTHPVANRPSFISSPWVLYSNAIKQNFSAAPLVPLISLHPPLQCSVTLPFSPVSSRLTGNSDTENYESNRETPSSKYGGQFGPCRMPCTNTIPLVELTDRLDDFSWSRSCNRTPKKRTHTHSATDCHIFCL
jgi:hypothetical protein